MRRNNAATCRCSRHAMNGNICEHNFNVGVGINPTYEELINTLRPEIEAILIKRINQSG